MSVVPTKEYLDQKLVDSTEDTILVIKAWLGKNSTANHDYQRAVRIQGYLAEIKKELRDIYVDRSNPRRKYNA